MKKIKFRAWDKDQKQMIDDWPDIECFEMVGLNGGDRFKVTQYTGLHDKKGKEIYEGDLLKLDSWSEIQQVKFVEGAFCLSSVEEKYSDYTSDIHYIHHAGIPQATVIGNIYENPELLKT